MIIQHPNGNSYLFVDNKVFVSAYNPQTNSVITVQLDLSLPLNNWEKQQKQNRPTHNCENVNSCYSQENVPFGEIYCSSCNAQFEMMNDYMLNALENQ